jgi:hypothetical protein
MSDWLGPGNYHRALAICSFVVISSDRDFSAFEQLGELCARHLNIVREIKSPQTAAQQVLERGDSA